MPTLLSGSNDISRIAWSTDWRLILFFCGLAVVPMLLILIVVVSCQSGVLSLEQVNDAFANLS
jgi:hypothetical protein